EDGEAASGSLGSAWGRSSPHRLVEVKGGAAMNDSRYLFERLDAYRVAREALCMGFGMRARLRGLPGDSRSQFERALASMVLNICEGTAQSTVEAQRRHY